MKVLIWFGCFFVATILNTLLGYATGIKAGYIVFYLVVYFVAKKLCNLWDERNSQKKEQRNSSQYNKGSFVVDNLNTTNKGVFCRDCGEKLPENSKFCSKCGLEILQQDMTVEDRYRVCEICGADIANDSSTCHVCGQTIS